MFTFPPKHAKQAKHQLKVLRQRVQILSDVIDDYVAQVDNLKGWLLAQATGVDVDLVLCGTWECEKSPIDYCAYNIEDDPACDDCLFCHQPDERK